MAKTKKPKKVNRMERALAALRKHWGHESFKPAQEQIIQRVFDGKDVLAVLPTGFGKSATFQVPAIVLPGSTLVISPLIALMKDQCDDCRRRGIAATYINSHVSGEEQEERFRDVIAGKYDLLYITPERIKNPRFRAGIKQVNVNLLAVDEVHAVSIWGHEFRPAYMRVRDLLPLLNKRPPILGVTATATWEIEDDIAQGVGMRKDYVRIVGDPIRPNLHYAVTWGNTWNSIREMVPFWDMEKGRYIVYCCTRKGAAMVQASIAEQIGMELLPYSERSSGDWSARNEQAREYGVRYVGLYHAGLSRDNRIAEQDAFKSGAKPVVVATCAFGMGIDVPNIRGIVHFGIPDSIESYVQETGRAGRDGKPSRVTLLVDKGDYSFTLRQFFLNSANPPYALYRALWGWLNATLAPGEILKLSGAGMAARVGAWLAKQGEAQDCLHGNSILSVLSVMEAHGLVRRLPSGVAGASITVDVDKFQVLYEHRGEYLPSVRAVIDCLWVEYLEPVVKYAQASTIQVSVLRAVLADTVGYAQSTVAVALGKIGEMDGVTAEPAFRGKTTQVMQHGADLDEYISEGVVSLRRARDEERLATMMRYTHVKDRVGMIREYFTRKMG